jgi:Ca2+-binding RTX toxin-like protein
LFWAGEAPSPLHLQRRFIVRRIVLLLSAMALVLCLCAGVALAYGDVGRGVTKTCGTHCEGTTYPDTLKGTSNENHIEGLGGNESATFGDLIHGFGNNDTLSGDRGGDRIEGGSAADSIFGGLGEDLLIGGKGRDHIDGGSGGDKIEVKDGYRDIVNCEGGNDNVRNRDRIDILHNC